MWSDLVENKWRKFWNLTYNWQTRYYINGCRYVKIVTRNSHARRLLMGKKYIFTPEVIVLTAHLEVANKAMSYEKPIQLREYKKQMGI